MPPLSQIVSVQISVQDTVPTRAGFGTPLLLDFNTVYGNVPFVLGTNNETFDFTADTDLTLYVDDGPLLQTVTIGPTGDAPLPSVPGATTAAEVVAIIAGNTTGITATVVGTAVQVASTAGDNIIVGGAAATTLGLTNPTSELVRTYSSTQAMIDDGFATTDAATVAAGVFFAQNPRVPSVKIGRRLTAPSQSYDLTFKTSTGGNVVEVAVGGPLGSATNSVSYTVLPADTPAAVATAVEGLLTALALPSITFSVLGDVLSIASTAAGQTQTILFRITDANGVQLPAEDHFDQADNSTDPGILTDYAGIKDQDNDFYGVILTSQSEAEYASLAGATGIEGDVRLMVATSGATDNLNGGGLGQTLATANLDRTGLIYHTESFEFADAAWMGTLFPEDPGSATWVFKSLQGVSADNLTDTQIANLQGNEVSYYVTFAGVDVTQGGRAASDRFLDITRGIDWLTARIQERIFGALANVKKVPFTDTGIAIIESELRAQLQDGIDQGVLTNDPQPTVSVPLAADVPVADRANRILPDVTFTAQLAGAIHQVQIVGTVTV
jgi:hypothetical protein